MEVASMIVKVAQEIGKAAAAAGQNKAKCQDMADRARAVGDLFGDSTLGVRYAELMSRPALDRLQASLDDALELVKSQSGFVALLTGGSADASFQDVVKRITACVKDLRLTEPYDARRHAIRTNKRTVSLAYSSVEKSSVDRNKWGMNNDVAYNGNKAGGQAAAAVNARKQQGWGWAADGKQEQKSWMAGGSQQQGWMGGGRHLHSYGAQSTPSEQLQRHSSQSLTKHQSSQSLTQHQSSQSSLSSWSAPTPSQQLSSWYAPPPSQQPSSRSAPPPSQQLSSRSAPPRQNN